MRWNRRRKGKKEELIEELVRICWDEFCKSSLPQWTKDRLCDGIWATLSKVPEEELPSIEIWKKYFPYDARQTTEFLLFDREVPRDENESMISAITDVLYHWKMQARAVCQNPSLLTMAYRARADRSGLPIVTKFSSY